MRAALSLFCRLLTAAAVILSPSLAAFDDNINARKYFPASEFPVAEQRRLASRLLGKEWLRDTEAEDYLRRITRELAPDDEHFVIVANADDVNAFAYIGGLIVIFRGLWGFASEEDGFVGVVAHEMGHVKLDHVQKTRENAERISTIATPFLIAGLLIDDPDTRQAVVAGSAGIISSDVIIYSRELEHEADVFALDAMVKAERNASAMARIFSRLGSGGNEYLSTHPSSERRGAYLADRLHDVAPPPQRQKLEYYLLREKFARHGVVERQYQKRRRTMIAEGNAAQQVVARYGLLLSATKTRNKKLGAEMVELLMPHKGEPVIARAISENLRQRGATGEALALIQEARGAYPERVPLLLELFIVNERLKRHADSLAVFDALPPALKENPDVLLAAGRAAAFLNKRLLSNYLLAHGQAKSGDFEQAQKQIVIAEKYSDAGTETVIALEQLKKRVERELKLLRERRVLAKN